MIKKTKIVKTSNVVLNEKNERFFNGLNGEDIALSELKKLNFSLVKQRYKSEYGEIDLIVEDIRKKLLVFVEVKMRKQVYDYSTVISSRQWKRIFTASEDFLEKNKEKYKDYTIRFDAIICFTDSDNIVHIENILQNDQE